MGIASVKVSVTGDGAEEKESEELGDGRDVGTASVLVVVVEEGMEESEEEDAYEDEGVVMGVDEGDEDGAMIGVNDDDDDTEEEEVVMVVVVEEEEDEEDGLRYDA